MRLNSPYLYNLSIPNGTQQSSTPVKHSLQKLKFNSRPTPFPCTLNESFQRDVACCALLIRSFIWSVNPDNRFCNSLIDDAKCDLISTPVVVILGYNLRTCTECCEM
ncbi:hypothetical protein AVEN_57220-1 [Araneus ventricosus]|uniref:Uncharacterized protein n=1 Tax=Araneus ventricosus TaxID=182803 RepID=A0A4Y2JBL7_ARAVE|nr:hypothetical protein AVEN_57220-1 [Araneus ventricosus]